MDDLIETLLSTINGSSEALFKKASEGGGAQAQLERLGAYFERPDANSSVRSSVTVILGEVSRNGQLLPRKAI